MCGHDNIMTGLAVQRGCNNYRRDVGILLPSHLLNVLTGSNVAEDTNEPQTLDPLARINGRPFFAWLVQGLLKSFVANSVKIYVLTSKPIEELSVFIKNHYPLSLVENVSKGNLEDQLRDILLKEAERASSITFLRTDVLLSCELPQKGNCQLFHDDKIILCKLEDCHFLLGNAHQGISLSAYLQGLDFDVFKLTSNQCLFINKNVNLMEARSKLIESRSFNSLRIHPVFPEILKSSKNRRKLENEVFWYREIPSKFKALAPQVFQYDENGIRMEYYAYGTLSEKFLYDSLSMSEWRDILQKLFGIVRLFSECRFECERGIFHSFYRGKFDARCASAKEIPDIEALFDLKNVVVNGVQYCGIPGLLSFICAKLEQIENSANATLAHGDLCFNNILFDVKSGIVKLIDPRGSIAGVTSLMCDPRYDIAKLKHSFCGNYDGIVEGEFYLDQLNDRSFDFNTAKDGNLIERESLFKNLCCEFGFDYYAISFIEAYLFLTMIPLHLDSVRKMKAFFLTAIIKFNNCLKFSNESLCRS